MSVRVDRVVVSNGFSKFHLAAAAAELARAGQLTALLTGVYPPPALAHFLQPRLQRLPAGVARMLARREDLDDRLVSASTVPELIYLFAMQARRSRVQWLRDLSHPLDRATFRLYGYGAARRLHRLPSFDVYHYRAGFGHGSVEIARKRGALVLCDQSLAHPFVLPSLLETGAVAPKAEVVPPMGRLIAEDIERADHVVVNSQFVQETMVAAGWDPGRVHVLYWGVDNAMLDRIQLKERTPRADALRLVFAGHAERRKGFQVLADALPLIEAPWRLTIAGPVSKECSGAVARLAALPNVTVAGNLSRADVARLLLDSDALVFPTLAEGSARIAFEALAAGCYLITTPNAGSVVVDGVGGRLVPPLDPRAVATAVDELWDERGRLDEISSHNASAIRECYTQRDYGSGLRALYRRLRCPA